MPRAAKARFGSWRAQFFFVIGAETSAIPLVTHHGKHAHRRASHLMRN
jgi:hypothetical protein